MLGELRPVRAQAVLRALGLRARQDLRLLPSSHGRERESKTFAVSFPSAATIAVTLDVSVSVKRNIKSPTTIFLPSNDLLALLDRSRGRLREPPVRRGVRAHGPQRMLQNVDRAAWTEPALPLRRRHAVAAPVHAAPQVALALPKDLNQAVTANFGGALSRSAPLGINHYDLPWPCLPVAAQQLRA